MSAGSLIAAYEILQQMLQVKNGKSWAYIAKRAA